MSRSGHSIQGPCGCVQLWRAWVPGFRASCALTEDKYALRRSRDGILAALAGLPSTTVGQLRMTPGRPSTRLALVYSYQDVSDQREPPSIESTTSLFAMIAVSNASEGGPYAQKHRGTSHDASMALGSPMKSARFHISNIKWSKHLYHAALHLESLAHVHAHGDG